MRSLITSKSAIRTTVVTTKLLLNFGNTSTEVLLRSMAPVHPARPQRNNPDFWAGVQVITEWLNSPMNYQESHKIQHQSSSRINKNFILFQDQLIGKACFTLFDSSFSSQVFSRIVAHPHFITSPTSIQKYTSHQQRDVMSQVHILERSIAFLHPSPDQP